MKFFLPIFFLLILCSCDKGYQVRFSNFYTESMDSVVVGDNKVVFVNTPTMQTTEFKPISKGKYGITFTTKSKKKFYSQITIPSSGSGDRTIQMDGIEQVAVLEE